MDIENKKCGPLQIEKHILDLLNYCSSYRNFDNSKVLLEMNTDYKRIITKISYYKGKVLETHPSPSII